MDFYKESFYTITHTQTYGYYLIILSLVIFGIFTIYYWVSGSLTYFINMFRGSPRELPKNGYNHMKPFDYEPENPYTKLTPTDNIPTEQPQEQQQPQIEQPLETPTQQSLQEQQQIEQPPQEQQQPQIEQPLEITTQQQP